MPDILIYTTQSCPHCKKLRKFLRKNEIDFEEKNIVENEEFLEEMLDKTGKALVPVIEMGDEIYIGFDRSIKREIKERLRKVPKIEAR